MNSGGWGVVYCVVFVLRSAVACSCCLGIYCSAAAAVTLRYEIVGTKEAVVVGVHVTGGAIDETVLRRFLVRVCTGPCSLIFSS